MNEYKERFIKLFKNPLLPISSTYPYVLVVVLLIGWIYMKNSGTVFQTSLTPSLIEKNLPQELEILEPKILTAVTMDVVKNGSPELLEKGKQSYVTICSSCHGTEGRGDGVAGAALNPKPRNFSAEDGWKNGRKITDLYRTLQKGLIQTGMPGYDYMPADERLGIIHYIQKTFMANPPETTEMDFTALDAEFSLTKGVEQPGQIPVSSAFVLLERNNQPNAAKLSSVRSKIIIDAATIDAANLFMSIVSDFQLATAALANNNSWMNSENDLPGAIQNNIINNGFNSKIFQLSEGEITLLYNYLKAQYL